MRYNKLRTTASKTKIWLTGMALSLIAPLFAQSEMFRVGLTRAIAPSPSGEWVAFRSEHWERDLRERTLTLKNLHNGIVYTLTPKYLELIEGPDPTLIAYLAKDSSLNWYVAGLYYLDEEARKKWDIPHPVSIASMSTSLIKKEIQFSDDGNYLRFLNESNVPFGGSGYKYRTVPEGFWNAEWTSKDFKGVTWFPRKKPSKLPDFMTASQPHIHEKTIPVWSPDEKHIYVHDKDGIWKVNILLPRMQKWELILPVKNVEAFSLSPGGRYVFLELAGGNGVSHPVIKEFDLEGEKPPHARFVGRGRNVMYADDSRAAFINDGRLYVLDRERIPRQINAAGQPKLGEDASLVWSSDSKRIYVRGKEGVWQISADSSTDGEWTLAMPIENLIAFQLSSSGQHMLIETVNKDDPKIPFSKLYREKREDPKFLKAGLPEPGYLRNIALVDLKSKQRAPQHIGKGWSSVFSSDGKLFFLADFAAAHIGETDNRKTRIIYRVARHGL